MEFKTWCYKCSVLIPISIIAVIQYNFITLSITEIGLYLSNVPFSILVLSLTVIWLCNSPFRRTCCNGTWTELLFNLFPVIILLMLVFAQWHFRIFICIIILIISTEIIFSISLHNDEQQSRYTPQWGKQKKRNKIIFHRLSMLTVGVFCAVPCIASVIVYDLRSPTYEAKPDTWELLSQVSEPAEEGENVYENNLDLFQCFKKERWKKYSIQEKTTIVQKLADFEAEMLGIPPVHLTTKLLNGLTIGKYSADTNEMWIDVETLSNSSVDEVIDTICHEVHHSFEHYLVDNIDWESCVTQTSYFDEARSWKENQQNYLHPYDKGFNSYKTQPVEAVARSYSEMETARILSYIEEKTGK